jgi:hypothetical protein
MNDILYQQSKQALKRFCSFLAYVLYIYVALTRANADFHTPCYNRNQLRQLLVSFIQKDERGIGSKQLATLQQAWTCVFAPFNLCKHIFWVITNCWSLHHALHNSLGRVAAFGNGLSFRLCSLHYNALLSQHTGDTHLIDLQIVHGTYAHGFWSEWCFITITIQYIQIRNEQINLYSPWL